MITASPLLLSKALRLLGLSRADLLWVKDASIPEIAQIRLDTIKAISKDNFRKASLIIHPDKTYNDEKKTELFRVVKELNAIIQNINSVEIKPKASFLIPLTHDFRLTWFPHLKGDTYGSC